MAGQVVERVNAYFGHRMIDDIRLVQGAIAAPRAAPPLPAPDAGDGGGMTERAAKVKDPELRAALARLGRACRAPAAGRRCWAWSAASCSSARFAPRTVDKLLEPLPGDHVLGKPDAPNTLIDYASFTCPHCAQFYIAVMPTLRKEWIDTGKLRLIHRHFPSDVVATRASQLAECAGPDKFFETVDLLFRSQVEWLTAADPQAEMVKVLAKDGADGGPAQACFANDRLFDKVVGDVQSGQTLGVRFTPTLFINEQNYGNPGRRRGHCRDFAPGGAVIV